MRRLGLSFPLGIDTPVYPGAPSVKISPHRQIHAGHPYNSFKIEAFNHAATHIDAPAHVILGGRPLCDFELDELVFEKPALIDVSVGDMELIEPIHLAASELREDSDLLFLRTGFSQHRRSDPVRYVEKGPGLSPRTAEFLVHSLPQLRGVGVDLVSITSVQHPDEGVLAHRALLGRQNPVLIIEDLNLQKDLSDLVRVIVAPIFVKGVDSSWCTVIAECR